MYFFTASIWQSLAGADRWLFETLNGQWTHPVLDGLLPFLREPLHWAPLYLFLLVFALYNFGTRGLWWCLFFICTFALTDLTGTYLFKHTFYRLRPCNDPDMLGHVRLLLKSCAGYSFISNHAANHFGIAVFFFITLRPWVGKWVWAGMIWAGLIAYAQVYVGLHYPSDVIAGAMMGVLAGSTTAWLFKKQFGFAIFEHQPTVRT